MSDVESTALAPPEFAGVPEYGARLTDVRFWLPFVRAALKRHGLPAPDVRAGTAGTFPTFLVGSYVVKLFTEWFEGGQCFAVERELSGLFGAHPAFPAPAFVADGRLFDQGWRWPYIITTRVDGASWRDGSPASAVRVAVAQQLGAAIRRVHALSPPATVRERDILPELRSGCVERQRRWGLLPKRLIAQIPTYLSPPSAARRLVHADLHADHIFISEGRLAGIIDWGDALFTDPYYELPALHFGTFGGDARLLRQFLTGYGWANGSDFMRRAMTMTLIHQFNVLEDVIGQIDLDAIPTLDALAARLWGLPAH